MTNNLGAKILILIMAFTLLISPVLYSKAYNDQEVSYASYESVQKEETRGDKAKALYVQAGVAAQRLEDNYVQKYKEYVVAYKDKQFDKASVLLNQCTGITSFEKIVGLILATELNAVVINVKDDGGNVTIPVESEYMAVVKSYNGQLSDIENIIAKLKLYDIYSIARIVVFKDNILATNVDHSIIFDNNTLWKDYSGSSWVNPYDDWVQEYNISVAKQAATIGFDEIQFDYVRFPEKFSQYEISKKYLKNNLRQDELIRGFLKNAYTQLKPYEVKVAADVFGCVAYLWDDPLNIDIGQVWYNLTQEVDYICPMAYPSHYRGTNWYTYEDPNQHPYEVIKGAIEDSLRINSAFYKGANIRFWLQDFSMYGYEYGPLQILDQVRALNEKGIDTYMFWNNKNVYEPENFFNLETQNIEKNKYLVHDIYRNNPTDAAIRYMDANIKRDPFNTFILTAIEKRDIEYKDFLKTVNYMNISGYSIKKYRSSFNTAQVFMDVDMNGQKESWVLLLFLEKGIWKSCGYLNIK